MPSLQCTGTIPIQESGLRRQPPKRVAVPIDSNAALGSLPGLRNQSGPLSLGSAIDLGQVCRGVRGREVSVANIEQTLQLADRCWVILHVEIDEPIVQAEITGTLPNDKDSSGLPAARIAARALAAEIA